MDRQPAFQRLFQPVKTERHDDGAAFLPDPEEHGGQAKTDVDLAEARAEQFVEAATTGENSDEELLDATVEEEIGGPFVESTGEVEFASGTDASNPPDAEPEPFPRPMTGLIQDPDVDFISEPSDGFRTSRDGLGPAELDLPRREPGEEEPG